MTLRQPHDAADGRGGDFLTGMVAAARERVAQARAAWPLRRPARAAHPGRLCAALEHPRAGGLAVIAEVKRASPSRGALAPGLDAAAQARAYELAGADAVSVLTEPTRFAGSLADLEAAARSVTVPVLRKDFIIDPYQVWEAAAAGAAAVLLIAAALDGDELAALFGECAATGLDALVEVHDEDDLLRTELAGARLVGINNRDLRTLAVDLATTEQLAPLASADTLLVAESGIATAADARRMAQAGAQALLAGEALVRAPQAELPTLIAAFRNAGGSHSSAEGEAAP
jgi:indole-3-glycerol phosphate synthase